MLKKIPIKKISLDHSLQARVKLDSEAVQRYADIIRDGGTLPAPDLVYDKDAKCFYVCDGWHRIEAHRLADKEEVRACVHEPKDGMTAREYALWHAVGSNTTHGVPRSNADKRRAVELALGQWPEWSDRRLAEVCVVSNHFVAKIREESTGNIPSSKRVGKDGKARKVPEVEAPASRYKWNENGVAINPDKECLTGDCKKIRVELTTAMAPDLTWRYGYRVELNLGDGDRGYSGPESLDGEILDSWEECAERFIGWVSQKLWNAAKGVKSPDKRRYLKRAFQSMSVWAQEKGLGESACKYLQDCADELQVNVEDAPPATPAPDPGEVNGPVEDAEPERGKIISVDGDKVSRGERPRPQMPVKVDIHGESGDLLFEDAARQLIEFIKRGGSVIPAACADQFAPGAGKVVIDPKAGVTFCGAIVSRDDDEIRSATRELIQAWKACAVAASAYRQVDARSIGASMMVMGACAFMTGVDGSRDYWPKTTQRAAEDFDS